MNSVFWHDPWNGAEHRETGNHFTHDAQYIIAVELQHVRVNRLSKYLVVLDVRLLTVYAAWIGGNELRIIKGQVDTIRHGVQEPVWQFATRI